MNRILLSALWLRLSIIDDRNSYHGYVIDQMFILLSDSAAIKIGI